MDSYDVLVIILSLTLAVFLVMAIMLMTYFVRIAKEISRITDKAGKVVDNIETVSKAASSTGTMSFIGNIISTVVENSLGQKNKGDKNE